jgi:hypothetical protein
LGIPILDFGKLGTHSLRAGKHLLAAFVRRGVWFDSLKGLERLRIGVADIPRVAVRGRPSKVPLRHFDGRRGVVSGLGSRPTREGSCGLSVVVASACGRAGLVAGHRTAIGLRAAVGRPVGRVARRSVASGSLAPFAVVARGAAGALSIARAASAIP